MFTIFEKKITVFSDFDGTLIKEQSGFMLVFSYIIEKKKEKSKRIKEGFKHFLKYIFDRNNSHLAEFVKDIDEKTLISVAKKLHFKQKWFENIEEIKKKYNVNSVNVIIVSRNLKELIEIFIKLNKEELDKRKIKIVKVIANTTKKRFLIFKNKIVQNNNKFEFLKGKEIIYLGDADDNYLKEIVDEFFEC
ncbi:MAG: haloacid dehalogenase-like hydrolase [Candidatus Woesearchaeota archaeon]